MNELDQLRKHIDKIDDLILQKLNERMSYVKKIGEIKQENGSSIYRPERERDILKRLEKFDGEFLEKDMIRAIFLEIFAASRNYETPQKVAYLGPEGTYTHQAARSRFGLMSQYLAVSSIETIFTKLWTKEVKYAVVPVENNTEGDVGATFDCLAKFDNIKIIAEIFLDIHHSFASLSDSLKDIKRIYSHPQGYNQCKNFLDSHMLLDVEFVPTKSTAQAAYFASKDLNSAAICSKIASNMYELPILFEAIEDNVENRTRFFVLSDFKTNSTSGSKTTVCIKTDHKPGALWDLLKIFKDRDINITKLQSRPIKQREFRSVFFMDFEGHIDDKNIQDIMQLSKVYGVDIKWLGSYIDEDDG